MEVIQVTKSKELSLKGNDSDLAQNLTPLPILNISKEESTPTAFSERKDKVVPQPTSKIESKDLTSTIFFIKSTFDFCSLPCSSSYPLARSSYIKKREIIGVFKI